MEIIPAIDIKGGKCVRLTQGKFDQQQLYSDDPVKVAKRWKDEGATRLHIIDLDAARLGTPQNKDIVRDIVRIIGLPVQYGGGVRSAEIAEGMINIGVDRVVFGTAAMQDPQIGETLAKLGDHAVVGIDATNGFVATHGWQQATRVKATDFTLDIIKRGARRIVFTDIARDGMLTGPNIDAIRAILAVCTVPIIASGGVGTLKDIEALLPLDVEGVIIGKSLYEGTVKLPEAIALAAAG
jgi:phosphoribosylformimino-5-aminoimidazole carboxamide ribotide isomerase